MIVGTITSGAIPSFVYHVANFGALYRSKMPQRPAGPTLGQPEGLSDAFHAPAGSGGTQKFPSAASPENLVVQG